LLLGYDSLLAFLERERGALDQKWMSTYTSRSSVVPVSLTVFTIFSILIFLLLGFWQLERLEEKNSLIQRLTQRLNTPAIDIKTVLNDSRDLEEFGGWRPVKLAGTWDLDRNIILEARTHQGKPGVHVVTPFHLDFGPTVLVNRGWFPDESRNAGSLKNLPKGLVKLSGILRVREKRGVFSPDNHLEKEEWHTLDVPEISRHLGLALAVPFFVVASEKIGEGQPSLAVPNLPNNHLSYAISWYALALAILVAYLIYLKQLVRQRMLEFRQMKNRKNNLKT
jgi:surfeit locus 1 family protein